MEDDSSYIDRVVQCKMPASRWFYPISEAVGSYQINVEIIVTCEYLPVLPSQVLKKKIPIDQPHKMFWILKEKSFTEVWLCYIFISAEGFFFFFF